jgi:bifunctional ADP-heptose synthase (sugar kinase/adenylyltransferase)
MVVDKMRALATSVVSVAGAGDTVMAAWVASRLLGRIPANAIEDASRAAAVVVGKPYTSTVTWDEIWTVKK